MTAEELSVKMDNFISEVRDTLVTLQSNHLSVLTRLNSLDLNGSAEILKTFGVWLKAHPEFMIHEAEAETKRQERERALRWLSNTIHFPVIRKIVLWILSATFAGVLLAMGTDLYNLRPVVTGIVHHFLGLP